MTDKKLDYYNSKTVEELCKEWRKKTIKTLKEFKELDCSNEIKETKKIPDTEIIKYALAKLIEEA